jgi:hypothetical protein
VTNSDHDHDRRSASYRFLVAGLAEMSEPVSAALVVVAGVPDDRV